MEKIVDEKARKIEILKAHENKLRTYSVYSYLSYPLEIFNKRLAVADICERARKVLLRA